jgi:hypothetical protein
MKIGKKLVVTIAAILMFAGTALGAATGTATFYVA